MPTASFFVRGLTLALLFASVASGCAAGDASEPIGAGGGHGSDAAAEGALDGGSGAGGSLDGGSETFADADGGGVDADAPTACTSDADCTSSKLGHVCDVPSGACVACSPSADTCPSGQYCSAEYVCEAGCKADADCASGDGGALACDATTHQCVGCTDDAECPAGTVCDGATKACAPGCTPQHACQPGRDCCGASCVELTKDPANCGACGAVCAAPAHGTAACSGGTCGIGACDPGFADCNGAPADGCEIDTTTDPANCGLCAFVCEAAHGTASCADSKCAIVSCAPLFGDCNASYADGCETDLSTSPLACGTCGNVCAITNGTSACAAGQCAVGTCANLFGDCDGDANDGCERNLANDSLNCGACGYVCSLPHAAAQCNVGACSIISCLSSYLDCNGTNVDGCEIDSTSDPQNCGACGQKCAFANATGVCSGGACGLGACTSGYANCDGVAANGCEASLATDVQHCGGCATKCTVAHGSPACQGSACKVQGCDGSFEDCNGAYADGCEVDTKGDVANCGGCGAVCSVKNGTPVCTGGTCGVGACLPGFADCDGNVANGCETNLKTVANCGGCGVACTTPGATPSCATGVCKVGLCDPGRLDCDGYVANGCEVDGSGDTNNCGACAAKCAVTHGAPTCQAGSCTIASCASGFDDCDLLYATGCETNLRTDLANCGACNTTCVLPHVKTPACANGACAVVECSAGFADCDGDPANGCEASLTSLANCGACGAACAPPNGTGACSAGGVCNVASCSGGFANCDGNATNGCEVATGSDVKNCGFCSNVCPSAGGTPSCTNGVCGSTPCPTGLGNCDGNGGNGCETVIHDDVNNCGGCGVKCTAPNGTAKCTGTTCGVASCNVGFADCNASPVDGCETNTHTTSNCGGCGSVCSPANGSGTCPAGVCQVQSCASGFGDCDGLATNGCETNTNASLANCGGCGSVCGGAHATPSCSGGICSLACNGGFANCDGSGANGCEADLGSVSSCGGCGKVCSSNHGTPSCNSGACQIACSAGYGDCNANAVDGCETSLTTTTSCGACGVACAPPHATGTCASGSCQVLACASGWGDCDGNPTNGCETDLTSSTTHCGSCTTVCGGAHGTATCSASKCGIACDAGWGNCDLSAANGCEADLSSSANCGVCGTNCGSGNYCNGGSCASCNTSQRCGPSCVACSGATPSCNGTSCVCSGGSCGAGAYCNGTSCSSCNTTSNCGPSCVACSGATPACGGASVGCQCTTSPDSCGGVSSWCNAGACAACGAGSCGNGRCDCGETSATCSADCGNPCPVGLALATWNSGDDGWTYDGLWRRDGGGYMVAGSPNSYNSPYTQNLTYGASVNLSACSTAKLTFSVRLADDPNWDDYKNQDKSERLYVQCSGDGGSSWNNLTPTTWPPNQSTCSTSYCSGGYMSSRAFGWTSQTDTLPAACRTATARFRFQAKGSSAWCLMNPGWYVDSVTVN